MGMMAAKHTDLVVGMDMHMIQPPPPAPPVMVPHPVAGMIMDPADYSPGACTVFINGLPRARAGTMCMMSPPHVPIGGMFVKPPLSEAEVYQGSSTVTADGEAMSAMSHQVLGCHDIGAPAPVRKWKSGGAKSLMKAGSVVIAIPAGAPVFLGGPPTTSASGNEIEGVELESIGIETVDPTGSAISGVWFELELADGSVRSGCTGIDGVALTTIPMGECKLRVTSAANSVACPSGSATSGTRSVSFVCGPKDDVYTVAARHGLGLKWNDIYEHADNRPLKELRADPWELLRGDVVVVPAALIPTFTITSGTTHRVELEPAVVTVKVRLLRHTGLPFADREVTVTWPLQATPISTATDADGLVSVSLPAEVERIEVAVVVRTLDSGQQLFERFRFEVGSLDPVDSESGVRGRLGNAGLTRRNTHYAIHQAERRAGREGVADGTWARKLDALVRKRDT